MDLEDVEPPEQAPESAKNSIASKGSRNRTASRTIQEQDFPLSQATAAGGDRVGISLQNILKGEVCFLSII